MAGLLCQVEESELGAFVRRITQGIEPNEVALIHRLIEQPDPAATALTKPTAEFDGVEIMPWSAARAQPLTGQLDGAVLELAAADGAADLLTRDDDAGTAGLGRGAAHIDLRNHHNLTVLPEACL